MNRPNSEKVGFKMQSSLVAPFERDSQREGDELRRYGAAIVAAVLSLALRQLLIPLLGTSNPYHTVWLAVAFAAWYCGPGPVILTTLISALGVWYWFLPPVHSFRIQDSKTDIPGMLGFLILSGVIIVLGEGHRRSLAKSKAAEEELRQLQRDLERKVEERTADLHTANESLRELSGRLQQMRDEERRRIARELHDGLGQLLAALTMNLAIVQAQTNKLDSAGARAISENASIINQISSEIRTLSHLLHPPLLDVAGLASALRWYVDGFSERSKIEVQLDIPQEFGRLSDEMEIAIFRMVQECLTNIHRHSGGTAAVIRVREEDHRLVVEVQDQGKGIPAEKQVELNSSGRTGVGFRGMRERLRQLGGTLEIRSDGTGTAVSAILPLDLAASQTAADH
ncbi:MAG TPA: sensor histidine kinase [Candidatus Sulfotelmatobacter sp.]|jgi:signal transduction histidine kinase|nr:sensor histidine kinase [Candidatus Sulfotelmatobacter sp.]